MVIDFIYKYNFIYIIVYFTIYINVYVKNSLYIAIRHITKNPSSFFNTDDSSPNTDNFETKK